YLSNYATINLQDEVSRVDGVSQVTYLGQRAYSIRAWLDPQRMAAREIAANDVVNAIRRQNVEAPIGELGQSPARRGQSFALTLDTLGRLTTPDQFGDVVLEVGQPTRAQVTPAQQAPGAQAGTGPAPFLDLGTTGRATTQRTGNGPTSLTGPSTTSAT